MFTTVAKTGLPCSVVYGVFLCANKRISWWVMLWVLNREELCFVFFALRSRVVGAQLSNYPRRRINM